MVKNILSNYLPIGAEQWVEKWCAGHRVIIEIKSARKRKLGDYRKEKNCHKISVNHDLNENLFFLTLTHEIAHLLSFAKYGKEIKPHGREWKFVFGKLIHQSLEVYPKDLQLILLNFAQNPKANFYAYAPLVSYFHHQKHPEALFLKDLEEGSLFFLEDKKFLKGEKRKIKYICTEQISGKSYIIDGLALVKLIDNDD